MRSRSAHPSTPMRRAVRPGHTKGRPHAARAPRARSHETARRHACPGEMGPTHRSLRVRYYRVSEKFRRFFGSASGLAATQGTNCRPSVAVSDKGSAGRRAVPSEVSCLMPTTATLIGCVVSGLVLLDWLPPVLGLNLLLLLLNAVRLMRMSKRAPATVTGR